MLVARNFLMLIEKHCRKAEKRKASSTNNAVTDMRAFRVPRAPRMRTYVRTCTRYVADRCAVLMRSHWMPCLKYREDE